MKQRAREVRTKVEKKHLDVYLRGVYKSFNNMNYSCTVEVKQHGTKEDCVWVILK